MRAADAARRGSNVVLDTIAPRTTCHSGVLGWESPLLYPAHVPVR